MPIDQLADLDHVKVINLGLILQGVFVICYTICSFVVATTANMGFNAVLTALLYILYVGGAYHVLTKSKVPLSVGFVIGVSVMITLLSLMTAVFWGQLADCTKGSFKGYTCTNPSAYSATAAFASLLFIIQVFFTAGLVLWRDEFITDSTSAYDDIHGSPTIPPDGGVPPYVGQSGGPPTSYNQSSTADL